VKKRTSFWTIATVVVLAACSSPAVSNQIGLRAEMESGPAINSSNGQYKAGAADIALTKVVSLPDDQLGFHFVISAPSLRGPCCSLFPRVALVGQGGAPSSGGIYDLDVAVDPTSVASDSTIGMRLFGGKPEHLMGTFTLNLSVLGVSR